MIYAMADIHGFYEVLQENIKRIKFDPEKDRLIFLGDYIDYGPQSGQVLRYLYDLQQEYGNERVIVLPGNHEAMLLEWLKIYRSPKRGAYSDYSEWLLTDSAAGFKCFRTLVSAQKFAEFEAAAKKGTAEQCNRLAAQMVEEECEDILRWLRKLPLFYETEDAIYVHAGVDEEAEDLWKFAASDDLCESIFLWKYPPTQGEFYKTVIAGHTGTGSKDLAGDRDFHDVYFDGASHYFIDGSVIYSGRIPILAYDEAKHAYYSIDPSGRKKKVRPYEKMH